MKNCKNCNEIHPSSELICGYCQRLDIDEIKTGKYKEQLLQDLNSFKKFNNKSYSLYILHFLITFLIPILIFLYYNKILSFENFFAFFLAEIALLGFGYPLILVEYFTFKSYYKKLQSIINAPESSEKFNKWVKDFFFFVGRNYTVRHKLAKHFYQFYHEVEKNRTRSIRLLLLCILAWIIMNIFFAKIIHVAPDYPNLLQYSLLYFIFPFIKLVLAVLLFSFLHTFIQFSRVIIELKQFSYPNKDYDFITGYFDLIDYFGKFSRNAKQNEIPMSLKYDFDEWIKVNWKSIAKEEAFEYFKKNVKTDVNLRNRYLFNHLDSNWESFKAFFDI
jgi:hypothetical protein